MCQNAYFGQLCIKQSIKVVGLVLLCTISKDLGQILSWCANLKRTNLKLRENEYSAYLNTTTLLFLIAGGVNFLFLDFFVIFCNVILCFWPIIFLIF